MLITFRATQQSVEWRKIGDRQRLAMAFSRVK
jgi:hypothetical protein